MRDLPRLAPDGLLTPEVRGWAEDKYRLVFHYAQMFATATKKQWHCRAYVDLFSGAGRAKLIETGAIVPSSPSLVLDLKDPFDKHVYCDLDGEKLAALQERIKREPPTKEACFLCQDSNEAVGAILDAVPMGSASFRVLTFCFADPYKLKNLRFETLRRLSTRYIDFLVLVPSGMDANRNRGHYEEPSNCTVDDFLGMTGWRQAWAEQGSGGLCFGDFVADQFGRQMAALGYRYGGLEEAKLIRSTDRNLPLYHLMFFSRSQLGQKFWREAQRYSTPQLDLFG